MLRKNLKGVLFVAVFLLVGLTSFAKVLKVGASPVPHAELLEVVKEDLTKEGVELQIIEFTDYVTPNLALADKEIDANFFQHVPYMNAFIADRKLDIISVGTVHVEPLGLYSAKIKDIKEIEEGATIAIPNDPANTARALILLHNNDVLKIKDVNNLLSTEFDIVENPKKIKIKSIEAAQLPRVLKDVDAAVINGNYALEAKLSPKKDALLLEGKESAYANIVSVLGADKDNEDVAKLVKALQSEKVKKYIEEKYTDGEVVPAF